MRERSPRLAAILALACWGALAGCNSENVPTRGELPQAKEEGSKAGEEMDGPLRRGVTPPAALARRPRVSNSTKPGLKTLPDGDLQEWRSSSVHWVESGSPIPGVKGWSAEGDLQAKLALASYGSGLSLALRVKDDVLRAASCASALARSDHVEIELIPRGRREKAPLANKMMGIHFRLGTNRLLVDVVRPRGTWRDRAISSAGVRGEGGYLLEARLPLSALTPLPDPVVKALRYRVTIHDSDAKDAAAEATLRLEGEVRLDPPLEAPEAVQKRGSIRVCLAAEEAALWGYWNGWRCAVPYIRDGVSQDDTAAQTTVKLGFSRVPEPPKIVWIRERVLFVNLPGVRRGVAALLDKRGTILSLMKLGVVGAEDPGNSRTKYSGAEHFKLPDGSWAVAVVHSYPEPARGMAGRCSGGHRVYLSVLALRFALTSTPHKPAPDPPQPPYFEEVFRVLLEDCNASVARDWSLSKDRQTIKIHSSIRPARPATVHVYRGGRYRLQGIR